MAFARSRIIVEGGSTTAYVIWGQNHLLQKRQFAWDGVIWYYQPTTRSNFMVVNEQDVPLSVRNGMSDALARAAAARDYKEEHGKSPDWE